MRKLTIQFLKSYLNSPMTDKSLNSAITDFLRHYDSREIQDFQIPEIIRKNLDIGMNIRESIEQGYQVINDRDLIENISFEFVSMDSIQLKSMSSEQLRKAYEDFERRAEACPVLNFHNYNLYNADGTFTLDWFLPIPINSSNFSNNKERKIKHNILRYFENFFNAEAELTWWSILSEPNIRGEEFLYDQIIFPEVYYNAFGITLDYKLIDKKKV